MGIGGECGEVLGKTDDVASNENVSPQKQFVRREICSVSDKMECILRCSHQITASLKQSGEEMG